MNPEQALQRLAHAGIVEQAGAEWHTTEKWDRAMMKAETKLVEYAEGVEDPRLPITYALVDLLGADVPEAQLESMVDAILPLEMREEQDMEPELEEELET